MLFLFFPFRLSIVVIDLFDMNGNVSIYMTKLTKRLLGLVGIELQVKERVEVVRGGVVELKNWVS